MSQVELRVEIEAWRYLRRRMERDSKNHSSVWCPDCFTISRYLETGILDTPVPKANWRTSAWWHGLQELKKLGVKHGMESVEVMMAVRRDEAVADNGFLSPLFSGRVRLCQPGEKDFVDRFLAKETGFVELRHALNR